MTNILIATPALSDAGALTASNEIATLPAQNLKKMQPRKLWRTNDLTSIYLELNLGSNTAINFIGLLYSNISSTGTWRIRTASSQANLTASPTYDTGNIDVWGSNDFSDRNFVHMLHYITASISDNTWIRIDVDDASNPDGYIEAGRLYVSNAFIPITNAAFGYGLEYKEESTAEDLIGGPTAVTLRENTAKRIFKFELEFQTKQEMLETALAIDRLRGISKDIFVSLDITDDYYYEHSLCGLMTELAPVIMPSHEVYKKRYSIKELI